MSNFFNSLNVSVTGMTAQRMRMDVISQNIANATTTRTEDGKAYKRKTVLFEEIKSPKFSDYFVSAVNRVHQGDGVKVSRIVTDESTGPKEYNPQHPDADSEGYVENSNVNIVSEMVNMISANRSYEANITAFNTTKSMIARTLEITR